MRTRKVLGTLAFLFCITISPEVLLARAETQRVPAADLGAFVKEIMKLKMVGDRTELAMWFPFEFYVEANLAESGQTRHVAEQELAFLKPYLTVIVQRSVNRADGSSLYSTEQDVRSRAVLVLPDNTEIRPLDKVSPIVAATVAAMKAMMASEGDPGGANLHVLVFPSKDTHGRWVVETDKKSRLKLLLKRDGRFGDSTFTWHTPFDAITSVPPCQKCKEPVSAKWSFCPWCGAKLAE